MTTKLANNEPVTMGGVLREAGYSDSVSKKPKIVTETADWKTLLAEMDDGELKNRLYSIALGKDTRSSLDAIKTILISLKGYGVDKEAKVIGLFEKVGELQNAKPETPTGENQLPAAPGTTTGIDLPK